MKNKVFFGVLTIFFTTSSVAAQVYNQNKLSSPSWPYVLGSFVAGISLILIPIIIWPYVARSKQWKLVHKSVFLLALLSGVIGIGYFFDLMNSRPTATGIELWFRLLIALVSLVALFLVLKVARTAFEETSPVGLEKLVADRTAALSELNKRLELEIESRKLAEKEVAKREKRFRALIENISDGIVLNDETTRVLYQSPSVTRILGYTLEERHNQPVMNNIHPDDKEAFAKLYEDLATLPGQPLPFQLRFKHKNGHFIWLEGVVTNLLHDRNVNGYVANYRDITARKEIDDRLVQERYLLRTLIDNLPDYIYIKDTELRHVINNKANVELIGALNEAETIGKTVLDYFSASIAKQFMEADRTVLSSGQPVLNLEEKIINRNNEVRWVLTSKIPLIEQDKISGLVGISRDITERKKAEDLLKELNASLALQASKLAASNTELERFAYVASHDLQEPLRMVRSFLQLLKKKFEGNLDDQAQQFIDYAVDGAERMKQLITDLLEYSRIGVVQEKFEPVDMNVVVQRTIEILQEPVRSSGTTFQIKTLPVVAGIKTQLGQVMQNLINNAIKYRGELPPQIAIDAIEEGTQWKFAVTDNGMGIDPRFSDKIFMMFQRLNTNAESKGTGIGLAICKKIVEGHGGKIWVESKPGLGSSFYFTISKR
ncbi:PAS domain-containing sensor histidine kinase [Chryseolinea sp. H1M3-3]|uniref:sensor histidine kinase n=1 Tax=Chryseolinea sp. H1M3-3 TaxID=3034144 RepID=UPI0023EB1B24|nr:PAS domain-containing sensor histidine kinase [Chryseolinea sp. H1M3-3]